MRLLFILLISPLLAFSQNISFEEQDVPVYLPAGWSMFGYSCMDSKDVAEAFSGFEDLIVIVKDGDGNPYLPEYGYNGLGPLQMHRGYQIKLTEAITDFQFCPFIVSMNNNCTDENACNYNTMQGPCEYADIGYDCDGNSITCYPIEDEGFLDYLKNDYDFYDLPVIIDDCLDVDAASNYTSIDIYESSTPIKDLDGLQYFTNIEEFYISGMDSLISIPNLSSLKNLSTILIVDNPHLTTIGDLSSLSNLTDLSVLRNPNLSQIPDHSQLINLDTLVFFSNGVNYDSQYLSNFTSLKALAVDDYSSQSQYFDSELFKNLEFYCICNASGTELTEELPEFKKLQLLSIYNNDSLVTLPDLSGLSNLEEINITYNNSLESLPDLSGLSNLKEINITYNNSLESLPDLSGLSNLKEIEIGINNLLKTIPDLSGLSNLEELAIVENNSLESLLGLSGLSNLRDLIISDNNSLKTIPDLSELTVLEYLQIEGNNSLITLPDFSGLSNLRDLIISDNNLLKIIPDLSGLSNLTQLSTSYNNSLCVGGYPDQLDIYFYYPPVCPTACPYDIFVEYSDSAYAYDESACLTLVVSGCTDTSAENYNSEANTNDGSCEYIYGCMDTNADNYNPEATKEDSSCIFYGCTNLQADNFDSQANQDDGSCLTYGCINPPAENYNAEANQDDGSCIVYGCTLSVFPNYNSAATEGDGSCDMSSTDIFGCTDSLAFTFNINANIDNGTCRYDPIVGDLAQGGIVFYVDETGQRRLVAAMEDLGYFEWGCFGEYVDGADGTSIGTGYQNTLDIVNQGCTSENGGITAVQAALDAEINGYSDWYLPSKDELIEMYNTIGQGASNVGGFSNSIYWSSSESGNISAWVVDFNQDSAVRLKKSFTFRVRPIRAF